MIRSPPRKVNTSVPFGRPSNESFDEAPPRVFIRLRLYIFRHFQGLLCFVWVSCNESVSSVKTHLPPPLKASALAPRVALKSREGNEDDQKTVFNCPSH